MVKRIDRDDVFMEAVFENEDRRTELLIEVYEGLLTIPFTGTFQRILTHQECLDVCEDLKLAPVAELDKFIKRLGAIGIGVDDVQRS